MFYVDQTVILLTIVVGQCRGQGSHLVVPPLEHLDKGPDILPGLLSLQLEICLWIQMMFIISLSPVVLHAEVVDEGRAAGGDQDLQQPHQVAPHSQGQHHGHRLQQVVHQIELHRHHVPVLSSGSGRFTQSDNIFVLKQCEPKISFLH